mgnify:CR=1 FL=1
MLQQQLLLMRHYMTSIAYNGRGNAVTLCKRRSLASRTRATLPARRTSATTAA